MNITRNRIKELVRETLTEENEYQAFFKKALEKAFDIDATNKYKMQNDLTEL